MKIFPRAILIRFIINNATRVSLPGPFLRFRLFESLVSLMGRAVEKVRNE